MASRKDKSAVPGDVPSPIVGALIVYLVAVFVPIVSVTPDLPTTLPPLSYSPDAVFRYHRAARVSPAVSFIDERFAALGTATANRDGPATAAAQREFVAFLVDARAVTAEARAAIREHHLAAFLRAYDDGRSDPLLTIALRHRLAGRYAEPGVDRATLMAWFDFRWEALAAPEALRGDRVTLGALLERIPSVDRSAVVSWILASTCESLLGVRPGTELDARDQQQCASVRREFVDAAATIDSNYPAEEARAAVEVLLARSLDRTARRSSEPEVRASTRGLSREAFERAQGLYTAIAEHDTSRRIRRYLRGSLEGAATD